MPWKCNFVCLTFEKVLEWHCFNWIEFSAVLKLSHLRVDEEKVSHWASATRFHRWAAGTQRPCNVGAPWRRLAYCIALWTLLHCKKYGPRRFCTQKANILEWPSVAPLIISYHANGYLMIYMTWLEAALIALKALILLCGANLLFYHSFKIELLRTHLVPEQFDNFLRSSHSSHSTQKTCNALYQCTQQIDEFLTFVHSLHSLHSIFILFQEHLHSKRVHTSFHYPW